ncbi:MULTISPECIES: aminoglycoside phosphotransferase family protein [unclassified Nocardia]|uniref:aminoglycoside phosphotransferase family protein n=1 Tax=unclassified Nocardia TaxID=2637762 RepID=UPI001CE3FDC2|nr:MULTISPECIES: aminoglycoside phosphotransferase family protein [unclassified Nocardia]
MIVVPEFFADRLVKMEPASREWLDGLPELAARYADRWQLRFVGAPMHGYGALVLPAVRADGTEVVLKLGWQTPETRDEPAALAAWQGRGAVLLLDSDAEHGALLLERLDPARSLDKHPIGEAERIIAELLRRLAIPAPPGISRDLRTESEHWMEQLPKDFHRLGAPFPRIHLDAVVDICRQLGPTADHLLVNEDLHYENVLAGAREPWLVIDPQPIAGDLEFTMLSLLWNREHESDLAHRFATIVETAALDPDKARAWTLVQCARNWLWFVEDEDYTDFGYAAVQSIMPWLFDRLP